MNAIFSAAPSFAPNAALRSGCGSLWYAAMAQDLFSLIETQIAGHGDGPAVRAPDGEIISYPMLAQTIASFAASAHERGLKQGDVVTIEIDNFAITLCLMFALSRLGVTVAIGNNYVAMTKAGLKLDAVISVELMVTKQPRNLAFSEKWFQPKKIQPLDHWPGLEDDDSIALIGASSGTSGVKKYMAFPVPLLAAHIDGYTVVSRNPGARMVTPAVGTIIGFTLMVHTLQTGCLLTAPSGHARNWLEIIKQHDVTESFTVPATVADMVRSQKSRPVDVSCLKRLAVGGGAVSEHLADEIRELICDELVFGYGSTELSQMATGRAADLKGTPGGVGWLMDWVEGGAVDEDGKPLKPGTVGELRLKVPEDMAIKRYIAGAEPGQEAALRDGWFHPGDMGYITEDGLVVLTGRNSYLINDGGDKWSPEVFENAVAGKFGVLQGGSVGLRNRDGFDDVCIAVIGERKPDLDRLRKHLETRFSDNTRFRLMQVEELPLNLGGKIDRLALRKLFSEAAG
jgi:acyl-coenzyme A synthetase/AMP-(fatty) acid ligase